MCDASAFPHTRNQCTTHVSRSIGGSGGPGVSRERPCPWVSPRYGVSHVSGTVEGGPVASSLQALGTHAIPALPGPLQALEIAIHSEGLRPQRGKHASVHPLDKVIVDRTGWAKA